MTSQKKISAVLFDFDMTLADSSFAIHHCTNLLAKHLGFREIPMDEVLAAIGLPIEDSWRSFWGAYKDEWVDFYRANYREEEQSRLKLFAGVPDMLKEFRNAGVKTGVVSNRRFARRAVEATGLTHLLDIVVGLEDVTRPKPQPDALFKGFELLCAAPETGVYVGDTDIDMKTSVAAGCRGLGVTTGNFEADELLSAGAWKVTDDIRKVQALLAL